eukprot:sb/3473142/
MVGSVRLAVKGSRKWSRGKGGREEGCSSQGVRWGVGIFGFTYRGRWRRRVDVGCRLNLRSLHQKTKKSVDFFVFRLTYYTCPYKGGSLKTRALGICSACQVFREKKIIFGCENRNIITCKVRFKRLDLRFLEIKGRSVYLRKGDLEFPGISGQVV